MALRWRKTGPSFKTNNVLILKGYSQDPGWILNLNILRDSGKPKTVFDGIRYLTASEGSAIRQQILAQDTLLGKKTVFGIDISEVPDEGLS